MKINLLRGEGVEVKKVKEMLFILNCKKHPFAKHDDFIIF